MDSLRHVYHELCEGHREGPFGEMSEIIDKR